MSNNKGYLFLYFLFFGISGFAGLIYESIWSHYLKIFLGSAAYAQVLVLVIFMGGLFLGSWLIARFAKSIKDSLKYYVCVELLICLFAFSFHNSFMFVSDVSYHNVIPHLANSWLVSFYKYSVAALLILPQTMLLGMTFPLMTNGIIQRYPSLPGKSIALLYFNNSLGAAIGVLVAGFIFIAEIGLNGSIIIAGYLNLLIVVVVFFLNRWTCPIKNSQEKSSLSTWKKADSFYTFLMWCAFLTGVASFIYEIGWIRMLSMVLGSSIQSFELMLSAFILGLALGSFFIHFKIDSINNALRFLASIQVIMGLCALLTLPLYNHMFYLMDYILQAISRSNSGYQVFHFSSHFIAMIIMLPATIFAGMTLPLLTFSLITRNYGEKSVGDIYAWNTLGGMLGTIVAISFAMPWFGLKGLIILGALIDIFTGLILCIWMWNSSRKLVLYFSAISLLLVLYVGMFVTLDRFLMSSDVSRLGLNHEGNKQLLYQKDGRTATVSVVKYSDSVVVLTTNGKPDASIKIGKEPALDEVTQTLLAAIPLALNTQKQNVALVGFGSGKTAQALLFDPDLKKLDIIEIEPAIIEGAKQFGNYVANTYKDKRCHINIEDAKTYFSTHGQLYDLIISEPSNPWVSGVASLFTKEFYAVIKEYLRSDGYFIQWIHAYENNDLLMGSIFKALKESFLHYQVYAVSDVDFLIIAYTHNNIPIFSNNIFKYAPLKNDLIRIGINNLDDLKFTFIGSDLTLAPIFDEMPIVANSDFFPTLAINAPKARFLKTHATILMSINLYNLSNLLEERENNSGIKINIPWFLKADLQNKALEIYNSIRNSFLMNNVSNENVPLLLALNPNNHLCLKKDSSSTWLNYYFLYHYSAFPFLNQKQQQYIENTIVDSACINQLSLLGKSFVKLFKAEMDKNYVEEEKISRQLLSSTNNELQISPLQKIYLLRSLLLAELMQKQYTTIAQDYQKYANLMNAVPEDWLKLEIAVIQLLAEVKLKDNQYPF